jgi:hypothetical protein
LEKEAPFIFLVLMILWIWVDLGGFWKKGWGQVGLGCFFEWIWGLGIYGVHHPPLLFLLGRFPEISEKPTPLSSSFFAKKRFK